jgi:hypothetical protein
MNSGSSAIDELVHLAVSHRLFGLIRLVVQAVERIISMDAVFRFHGPDVRELLAAIGEGHRFAIFQDPYERSGSRAQLRS